MNALARRVIAAIEASGPMTFAEYMSRALYDSELGYYGRGAVRTGWRGHFVTSPEIATTFGALWAEGFRRMWVAAGRPDAFDVVEIGAGEGGFAASVLDAVDDDLRPHLRYRIVERVGAVAQRQRALLVGQRVQWHRDVRDIAGLDAGCVFANEVLDNMPVHLLERRDGRVVELYVGVEGRRLTLVPGPPSTPALEERVDATPALARDGGRAEVSLAALAFTRRAAAMLARGALVFTDYGMTAAELAGRSGGTLVTYGPAGAGDDPLTDPGERDITAHVDWTAIEGALRSEGWTVSRRSQRDVLRALGLDARHDDLRTAHARALREGRGADAVRALSERQALGAMADPGGLGRLDVVVAHKGIAAPLPPERDEGPGLPRPS